jgi:hypothetical protein
MFSYDDDGDDVVSVYKWALPGPVLRYQMVLPTPRVVLPITRSLIPSSFLAMAPLCSARRRRRLPFVAFEAPDRLSRHF